MKESLLKILVCPRCKGPLSKGNDYDWLKCRACGVAYPVISGIPVLVEGAKGKHYRKQTDYFLRESRSGYVEKALEPWQISYIRRLRSTWSFNSKSLACDVGTGSGYISIELAKNNINVLSCDLTFENLLLLKRKADFLGLTNIDFICCNAESLPLENSIITHYISNAVFEHLPKYGEALSEMHRVTSTDARAMITAPLSYKHLNPLFIPINYIHDRRIGHLRRYDIDIFRLDLPLWDIEKLFYTGHSAKVFLTLINLIVKIIDKKTIEDIDETHIHSPKYASNITVFVQKKH